MAVIWITAAHNLFIVFQYCVLAKEVGLYLEVEAFAKNVVLHLEGFAANMINNNDLTKVTFVKIKHLNNLFIAIKVKLLNLNIII